MAVDLSDTARRRGADTWWPRLIRADFGALKPGGGAPEAVCTSHEVGAAWWAVAGCGCRVAPVSSARGGWVGDGGEGEWDGIREVMAVG